MSGSVPRRRFLGVVGLAGVAALDACSGGRRGGPDPRRTIGAAPATPITAPSTTTTLSALAPGNAVDVLILRTASSIEAYAPCSTWALSQSSCSLGRFMIIARCYRFERI